MTIWETLIAFAIVSSVAAIALLAMHLGGLK
jgi:hypothetical protein